MLDQFTYDLNGNTTGESVSGVILRYNKENRLVSHFDGVSSTMTLTYAEGGRVQNVRNKILDGAVTTLVWDGDDYLGMQS